MLQNIRKASSTISNHSLVCSQLQNGKKVEINYSQKVFLQIILQIIRSTEETCLQDFLGTLKRMLEEMIYRY